MYSKKCKYKKLIYLYINLDMEIHWIRLEDTNFGIVFK